MLTENCTYVFLGAQEHWFLPWHTETPTVPLLSTSYDFFGDSEVEVLSSAKALLFSFSWDLTCMPRADKQARQGNEPQTQVEGIAK